MDEVDDKTRETAAAATLLDVLWTSKKNSEATTKTTAEMMTASLEDSNANEKELLSRRRRIITNGTASGSRSPTATTTTTLQHGFDTNGWGNGTNIRPTPANIPIDSRQKNICINSTSNNGIDNVPKIQQKSLTENEIHEIHMKTKASLPSVATNSFQHQHHQHQHQQQRQQQNYNNDHSVATASSSNNSSTSASAAMMMSVKSIGFGIDNSGTNSNDATEAASKAIRDAMERSMLQFPLLYNPSLQIKIQLGVPISLLDDTATNNPKNEQKQKPMDVDLSRLSHVLPNVLPAPIVEVVVGGLSILGDSPGSSSICTAVACITLHSRPQSQQQSEAQPQAPPLPPLPPCPSLASAKLTTTTTATTRIVQQLQQEDEPNISQQQQQQWLVTNANNTQSNPSWHTSKVSSSSPSIVSTNAMVLSSSTASTSAASMLSDRSTSPFVPAATSSALATRNGHPKMIIPSDNSTLPCYRNSNQKQRQQEKGHQRNDHRGSTNSIEMLAMISEQEINRRNILGVGSTSFVDTTDASTSAVARCTSDDSNISGIDRNSSSTSAQTAILLEQSRQGQYQLAKQLELNSQLQSVNHEQQQNLQLLEAQDSSLNNHQQDTQRLQQNPMDIFHRQSVDNLNLDTNNEHVIINGDQNALGSRKNASTATARNLAATYNVDTTRRMAGVSYRDYSNEQPQPEERDCWALSTRTTSSPVFPLKLHETLTQIDKDGYDDIIGWLPHGRSFKIHKQKEFTDIILPRYVLYTRFISNGIFCTSSD